MINYHLSGWLLASVVLSAVAAFGLVSSPRHRLRNAISCADTQDDQRRTLPSWMLGLRARDDAWSRLKRALVAGAVALGIGFVVQATASSLSWLGYLAVPLCGVAGFIALGRMEPAATRRNRQQLILDLPQTYELLGACLGAGLPLRTAAIQVAAALQGPAAELLQRVITNIELGLGEAESWRALKSHPQIGRAAVDLARSVESGTMMVETLRHHAQESRRVRRAELEAAAKTVGVQSVLPLMICFLPAFFLIGIVPTVASALISALG